MSKILEYNVTGQNIELSSAAMLVAGTVNEYTARFSFSDDWNGYQRLAVFNADGTEREQLLTDDTCTVPWEVLLPGAYLKVGVYGTRDGSRLPTIWTSHRQYIHDGAGPTDEAAAPSPVLAEQILQRMGDLGALKTEDKSSLVAAINEVQETGGGGGTSDHSKLKNRDAADQHPMSSITGLEGALAGKQPVGSYLTDKDLDATLTVEGKAADAKAVGDALANVTVSGSGWTTAQINLLDSLFSAIPWTTGAAGALADSLIESLRATSSGGGGTGGGSGGETDNITQSGSTLIITSLAIAPTQSGSVLTIA